MNLTMTLISVMMVMNKGVIQPFPTSYTRINKDVMKDHWR